MLAKTWSLHSASSQPTT